MTRRSGLGTGVGATLAAAAIAAAADAVHSGAPMQIAAVWAIVALPIALAGGVIGAFAPRVQLARPLAIVALVTGALVAAAATVLAWHAVAAPPPEKLFAPALIPVGAIMIAVAAAGRLRMRGAVVAAGAVVAIALPLVALRGKPSRDALHAVMERSWIGGPVIEVVRDHIDRDGDGYSGFFGGPDCDDDDPRVHPGAIEIPGNGIDDNCFGGDAPLPAAKPAPPPPQALASANVLIVFIDTLRYDRLGIAGYRRDGGSLTPHLDAFAAGAAVFRRAYAQAPATFRSAPSFLASRYPSQLAVAREDVDYPTLLDRNDLLFEPLAAAGFATIGVSSHYYFCDPASCPGFAQPLRSNVTQGATEWDNAGAVDIDPSNHDVAGPRIVDKAIARLDKLAAAPGRFAMLVHLFDPHSTYMEHDGWPVTAHGDAALAQKYDYEIAFEDVQLGRLFDALDKDGLAKTTTVVVLSDHGDAFGVHQIAGERLFFHGQSLYEELLHVPLIVRVPGAPPRPIDDVVELVDVAPTVAALLGVAAPASWIGRSLVPLLAGQPLAPAPAFSELVPQPAWQREWKSMIAGTKHVIYRVDERRWEIYDLATDPQERYDLSDRDPDAEHLEQQLMQWIDGPLVAGGGGCRACARR